MADYRKASDLDSDELDLTGEELESQVTRAQEQLLELRRRAETLEKEKQKLEELTRRQDEFEKGKADMIDKLSRSIAVLQREAADCEKRGEQLAAIHEAFTGHLKELDAINPKLWSTGDLPKELTRALSSVEDAKAEYAKLYPKIGAEMPDEPHAGAAEYEEMYAAADRGFGYWLMAGFAFTLPLSVLGLVGLAMWLWQLAGAQ